MIKIAKTLKTAGLTITLLIAAVISGVVFSESIRFFAEKDPKWVTDVIFYFDKVYSIDSPSIIFTRTVNVNVVTVDWIAELHAANTGKQVCKSFVKKNGVMNNIEEKSKYFSMRDFFGDICIPPPGEYYEYSE